jgi:hypothetical protein
MTELTQAELAKDLGFRPATAKGWTWTWQRHVAATTTESA